MAPTKTTTTPTRRPSKRKAVHYKTKSARRSELREGRGRPPKATITPTPRQSKRKVSVDETNSLRRSKRRKDGDGNMIVTPIAASTSIRERALIPSISGRSGRIYEGSKFSLDVLQQKRDLRKAQHQNPNDTFVERITRTTLPFSPEPIGHTTPPYPIETSTNKPNGNSDLEGGVNQTGNDNPEEEKTAADEERFCYCDDIDSDTIQDNEWIGCAECDGWYHLACTGWSLEEEDDNTQFFVSPFGGRLEVGNPDDPWYCIRCWESKKGACLPFESCTLKEKALRLGCPVDEKISEKAFLRKLNQYVGSMRTIINDDGLVDSIIHNRPRPYPTMKPMSKDARLSHALWGRRFEIQQLMIDVGKCDCCGIVKPFAADPWLKAKWMPTSDFHRLHLIQDFHPARRCDCDTVCCGEQFWCSTRRKHKDAYHRLHPNANPYKWEDNTTLCRTCHNDTIMDGEFEEDVTTHL
jgi:hypothetical protein